MNVASWAIPILLGLGVATALAVLYTFAMSMERARELHDLRVRVFELRNAYMSRLGRREMADEVIVAEVDANDEMFASRTLGEDRTTGHPPTARAGGGGGGRRKAA